MTTPRTMKLPCWTCDADQQHRQLDKAEQDWLKERLGRTGVNEFWLCENVLDPDTGRRCRNLRTGFVMKPFPKAVRVPVPE
ncbi:hypothetical protein ACFWOL_23795 [Streptomyces sp. NPDC058442]|uniref:hypothetical protein n=1 Tax=Streptomyces sp. NPDC058442 TaxID=3346503 RepID=UPI0036503359